MLKRIVIGAILAAAFIAGTATTALARTGNGPVWIGDDWGHLNGTITWYARGVNHGGMGVSGNLMDSRPSDGRFVYVDGRVSGYGYTRLWNNYEGGQNPVYGNKVVYDPAATYVTYGWVRVCANHPLTDPCQEEYNRRS